MGNINQYYSKRELAQLLAVSTATIDRYVRDGKLKKTKLGFATRFSEKDVQAFLSEQEKGAPQ
ncbi:excisionase family DNA binding protein [Volucribacter psittacicida]|uniref:Excisionase family DNA binding protein n=1 Tax=Volucribacter psittacicida TaxID=203482 RepID=A0A4R1G1X8_9PAST|nr:helix-turn-helix domain-containing protein [Volucribacter psittacicida]TCK01674.1 excisionase family DNA binding protein [Volucribacter psittacicida]